MAAGPDISKEAHAAPRHPASAPPNSFFSLAFASSSCFSRPALETSIPPYLTVRLYSTASKIPLLVSQVTARSRLRRRWRRGRQRL